ncbi:hypothetical protein NHX12_034168 [Muraenolepis orangiensis]|uniref:Uncharacterized protein n=1 Tax=Muraenolepis orangiensis TaxID=630683 RepID=A0A9Q0D7D4_9TELE|nr:hypothetical protein NHX12_034168 [Muraenolepis orangiensis]
MDSGKPMILRLLRRLRPSSGAGFSKKKTLLAISKLTALASNMEQGQLRKQLNGTTPLPPPGSTRLPGLHTCLLGS